MIKYLFTVSRLFGLLRREMNGACFILLETWLVARSPPTPALASAGASVNSAGYTAALA